VDTETKGYKKTKDRTDEINETHSGMQLIRPKKKVRYFRI